MQSKNYYKITHIHNIPALQRNN